MRPSLTDLQAAVKAGPVTRLAQQDLPAHTATLGTLNVFQHPLHPHPPLVLLHHLPPAALKPHGLNVSTPHGFGTKSDRSLGGGQGWTGGTTCTPGWTCTYGNPWYSQCKPTPASSTAAASPSSVPATGGTTYKSTFTFYGAGDSFGSPNCNTNTAACGFYTYPGFSAAASQNLYGVGPGAVSNPFPTHMADQWLINLNREQVLPAAHAGSSQSRQTAAVTNCPMLETQSPS